jgi:hypothetical protein
MNFQSSQDIIFFILFFIPGFIMLKVYSLLIAREKFDFSSGLIEAVAFSCINYALCSPLIIIMLKDDWLANQFNVFLIILFIIIFILPIGLAKLYVILLNSRWAAKNKVLEPHKSAWDFFFSQRKCKWVIVTLKNGNKIAGKYNLDSFASAYPGKDIYISEVWKLVQNASAFERKVNRTSGIIIFESEISSIEFFN